MAALDARRENQIVVQLPRRDLPRKRNEMLEHWTRQRDFLRDESLFSADFAANTGTME
jgi:hypothetical protein